MAKQTTQVTKRDVETLNHLKERLQPYCTGGMFPVQEQEDLIKEVEVFFADEIETAMNYTGRLPSYYNCGGAEERKALLKQEAFLIVWQHMHTSIDEMQDFDDYLRTFRESIFKKLYECTQQAQKESIHVDVKQNKRTNENERCTVLSGGKDITAAACNPNYENAQDDSEDANSIMDCTMGPFQSF